MKVITTHLHADFDCLGAMVAAKKLYPDAELVFPGAQEKQVRDFLDKGGFPIHFRRLKGLDMEKVDLLVVVDASTRERIGVFAEVAERPDVVTHLYDHHPAGKVDVPHELAVVRDRGATVTIFTEIFRERGISITPSEATLLMLGLYEDTGSLTFSSVTREDYQAAQWLHEKGADLDIVKTNLIQELSAVQVDLLNSLLKSLEYHKTAGVNVAIAQATARRYVGDLSTLAHRIMDIENPAALFTLVRMGDRIHLIARSRAEGVDAGLVASQLGGGGHPTAASATIKGMMLPQLIDNLKAAIEKSVETLLLTGDIMETKAITATAGEAMDDVDSRMSRFEISGMPVLGEGKVAGIITRHTVQKAKMHGMGARPVEEFMQTEFSSLKKDTPLTALERLVIGARQKLAPVVDDDGNLLGIVTRGMALGKIYGDSLKAQGRESSGARREPLSKNISNLLNDLLDQGPRRLLALAAEAGDELGYTVYVAGGFPRDLLLRAPVSDMDIVTEGDGIELARALAKKLGGRVHPHEKFKTAVVSLPDGEKLDVATARIEYYPQPAALPVVEHGAIRNDLYRRDFSINAMAIRLNGPKPGMLIDFFGGQADLKNHAIRALHNLSFVEDPTRAFRAVRFEARYGFTMGQQTLSLLKNAVKHQLFDRLSGERMMTEIVMILKERHPLPAVARLKELDLLKFIHPGISYGPQVEEVMERLEELLAWHALSFPEGAIRKWLAYLMALMDSLPPEERERMRAAYMSSRHVVEKAAQGLLDAENAFRLCKHVIRKGPALSAVHDLFERLSPEVMLFLAAKSPGPEMRNLVTRYMQAAGKQKPLLNGKDLIRLGAQPSEELGQALKQVYKAQLDGKVSSREEALKLAVELVGG